jgi:hypothetical protein
MRRLQLLPIGNLDDRLLVELAPAMANLFQVPTEILFSSLDPEFAYHRERQQFHSSEWTRIPGECWELRRSIFISLF